MAAGGADLKVAFAKFATKGDKSEATSKDMTKWLKDAKAFGKSCTSNNMDIAFSKVKPKGKNTITMKELGPLIDELAKSYKVDKKLDEAEAKKKLTECLAAANPVGHGTTKTSATGGVDKMTDASNYTGSHKERFDADGKGKGIKGRADVVANDGYVGNYQGKDTYDKKVGKK